MEKSIGFDATEDHRVGSGGTYATPKNMNIAADPAVPHYRDRYTFRYPLREWGLDREKCIRIIADAGLPVPPKSACFMCPAMRQIEVMQLAKTDPELHALALEMERLYRNGRHFRGDNWYTVKATHKVTKEKLVVEMSANSIPHAREIFRATHNDTAKPYRWSLGVCEAVVGLGRHWKWEDVEIPANNSATGTNTLA